MNKKFKTVIFKSNAGIFAPIFEKDTSPILVVDFWEDDGVDHSVIYQNGVEIFRGDEDELYLFLGICPEGCFNVETRCETFNNVKHEVVEVCKCCGRVIERRYQEAPDIGPHYDWEVELGC